MSEVSEPCAELRWQNEVSCVSLEVLKDVKMQGKETNEEKFKSASVRRGTDSAKVDGKRASRKKMTHLRSSKKT